MGNQRSWFSWDKYAKIELFFFVVLSFGIPLLSDLEYSFNEEPHQFQNNYYTVNIIRRLVWGSYHLVAYYLFYKLAIQPLLIRKKYFYFLLSFVGFIIFLELFTVYGMYWSIGKMSFLPVEMTTEAKRYMQARPFLHFTVSYLLLQVLQMVALAYYIHYDKQQKAIEELQRIQLESDLAYLKAQLQPHFFFNTLNNIYSLALQRSELTAPLVAKLSEMMRYVLYESKENKVSLVKEIDFLRNYVDVQSVRYHQRISIRFDTQGIRNDAMIEPLLLLPFIENSFKHGTEEEAGEGFIETIICLTGDELTLSVTNSKAAKASSEQHGIGIATTQKRLSLLYPGKHSLQIREEENVYTIVLTLILGS